MFQLAVFDISRGNREGHEEEKIIAWSPSDTPLQEQLSNAGLLQAMLQLGGYFSDSMESCEVVENENSIWVVRQLFGSLYISCLVEKSSLGRHTSHRSLVGVLRCVEDLSTLLAPKQMQEKMFKTSIAAVLERSAMDLQNEYSWVRKQLRNPFARTFGAHTCQLPAGMGLELNTLANTLLLRKDTRLNVTNVLMSLQEMILWSTFLPGITEQLGSLLTSSIFDGLCSDCKLATTIRECPRLWLGGKATYTYAILMHEASLLVQLEIATNEEKQAFDPEALSSVKSRLEEVLIDVKDSLKRFGVQKKNLGHVQGCRYCYCLPDGFQCSPREKVSSASHHTRAVGTTLLDFSINESLDNKASQIETFTCCKSRLGSWGVLSTSHGNMQLSVFDNVTGKDLLTQLQSFEDRMSSLSSNAP